MTEQEHVFFFDSIRDFVALKKLFEKVASGMQGLETHLVSYDNKLASMANQIREKESKLMVIEKNIKEAACLAEQGSNMVKTELHKKHLDLIERERKLSNQEQAVLETQKKVDLLLSAAEDKLGRRKVAV